MDQPNDIILRERREAVISGVLDVLSFDDMQVEAETTGGRLILQGKGLAIDGLDKEKGSLRVSGQIDRLAYIEAKKKKGFSLLEALRK
ncbi:MAG: YabP/YqfC family sporulation protein [Clostridia bacterium]|nr:YabP/YqfC family sporulation protein [Clostridia bacterium]MBR5743237.1 YabP/YqfC family sporulation protein [Clostridia bacterium]